MLNIYCGVTCVYNLPDYYGCWEIGNDVHNYDSPQRRSKWNERISASITCVVVFKFAWMGNFWFVFFQMRHIETKRCPTLTRTQINERWMEVLIQQSLCFVFKNQIIQQTNFESEFRELYLMHNFAFPSSGNVCINLDVAPGDNLRVCFYWYIGCKSLRVNTVVG